MSQNILRWRKISIRRKRAEPESRMQRTGTQACQVSLKPSRAHHSLCHVSLLVQTIKVLLRRSLVLTIWPESHASPQCLGLSPVYLDVLKAVKKVVGDRNRHIITGAALGQVLTDASFDSAYLFIL